MKGKKLIATSALQSVLLYLLKALKSESIVFLSVELDVRLLDKCGQGLRLEGFLNYIFCGHKLVLELDPPH